MGVVSGTPARAGPISAYDGIVGKTMTERQYRESLPPDCPPDGAREITSSEAVFRLVRTDPPTADDFRSQRAEKPFHQFHGVNECRARGPSVFSRREEASQQALKLPALRGRLVCRVQLESGAGRVQQTGQRFHHTWWPLAEFDILRRCAVEAT